jgi:ribosomal protein L40E
MITEDVHILYMSAASLILVFIASRIVNKKCSSFVNSLKLKNGLAVFERQRVSIHKQCPHCAAELPLSAIICEQCDYNFLAERPGRGQKLLPPPEPITLELTEQTLASAGL